jgi:hypothetical protein
MKDLEVCPEIWIPSLLFFFSTLQKTRTYVMFYCPDITFVIIAFWVVEECILVSVQGDAFNMVIDASIEFKTISSMEQKQMKKETVHGVPQMKTTARKLFPYRVLLVLE